MITHRIATTPADFVAVRSLISDTWIAARPHVPFTVATLEWSMSLSPPETDWSERVHLWEDDGEVVGIAWYTPDGMAEGMVRAGRSDGPIEDAAFELHRSIAARDGVAELGWFAIDGHEPEAARLARHGFAPTEMTLTQWHQTLVSTPPPPIVPDGYRVRTLTGGVEVPARVEVHRAAFAPSHMTFERYARTMRQPHYAIDRDVVGRGARRLVRGVRDRLVRPAGPGRRVRARRDAPGPPPAWPRARGASPRPGPAPPGRRAGRRSSSPSRTTPRRRRSTRRPGSMPWPRIAAGHARADPAPTISR